MEKTILFAVNGNRLLMGAEAEWFLRAATSLNYQKPATIDLQPLPLPSWQTMQMQQMTNCRCVLPPLVDGKRIGYSRTKGGGDHAAGDADAEPDPPLSADPAGE